MKINVGYVSNNHPVMLDTEAAVNSHILCLGESGCGKTVEAQHIMTEIVKQGGTVLAISMHESLSIGQIYVRYKIDFERYGNHIYAHKDGIPCALFTPVTYPDGTRESILEMTGGIADAIARACKIGRKDRILLEDAIEAVAGDSDLYETEGFQTIGHKLQENASADSVMLYKSMKALFSHNIFREGELITQGCINIVHLDRLDLRTQEMAAELVLAYIWRMCNASQFQKNNLWLFLDECQNFDPKGALPQMISESRKMGVNLILATQVLPVVTRNAVWERVMQCGTKLYFKPSEDCLVRTAKLIGNSNHQPWIKVLRELKVGEFVADGGLSSGASKINYPIRLHNREPVGFSDTMK